MSVTMQGSWTVQVKSKSAAFRQRFVVYGSSNGKDGVYDGKEGTPPVFITGTQWSIIVEHSADNGATWKPSAERISTPVKNAGQIEFDICSNDTGPDKDYNDLILTCWLPESDSEYVVYGKVRSYKGACGFNPCFPYPYVVIDTRGQLLKMLENDAIRAVLKKLYPDRVRVATRPVITRKPFPEPDPEPFHPLMIPLREADARTPVYEALPAESGKTAAVAGPQAMAFAVKADVPAYALEIARMKDRFFGKCSVKDRPGVLLRFFEYDRTTAELTGGPYSGEGYRELLGLCVSDELGNYIFRFSWGLDDIAAETSDVPASGTMSTELRPDIIAQIIDGSGTSQEIMFETALYKNISNVKKINICFPQETYPGGLAACQGGRVIQAIGNIYTISGVGNTFDSEGRITATHSSGPQITRGAWCGALHVFGCFKDLKNVTHYTIRFRKTGAAASEPWQFVRETLNHVYIPAIGDPNSLLHKVGPFDMSLHVDGSSKKQTVPAYTNIESNMQWIETHRLRKAILSSGVYTNIVCLGPSGSVDFWIEGYNEATGKKVTGADDTITLFIDSGYIDGDIAGITRGSSLPVECALFNLSKADEALTIRFRVDQKNGFLKNYHLSVFRGSGTPVAVLDTTAPVQPLDLSYGESVHGDVFHGTLEAVAPDGSGYVTAELQPVSGSWLPSNKPFCAFAFEIYGIPRVTDGYNLGVNRRVDVELVGIQYIKP